ncbi:MAG: 3-oxoacid CoA-transferase subunit A [Bradyrhizobiaceae bacterium]|nr:MAG: 3-oxoacid CoA-transferase subunit A [Bradyrhizobiaceae bacterium]
MIDKSVASYREAVDGLSSGQTVMVGGFGVAGVPRGLVAAVLKSKPRDLTVIANNAGFGAGDITDWLDAGLVRKVICSYPRTSPKFVELYRQRKIELELIPQGTLAERIRCAGAGLGGFLSPVSAGTLLAEGKESRTIKGREYVLEDPLSADFAFLRAKFADRMGNLTYNMTARNFAPIMATAATTVVVEAERVVDIGDIDPETVVTPGILIDRVVEQGALQ